MPLKAQLAHYQPNFPNPLELAVGTNIWTSNVQMNMFKLKEVGF